MSVSLCLSEFKFAKLAVSVFVNGVCDLSWVEVGNAAYVSFARNAIIQQAEENDPAPGVRNGNNVFDIF